MSDRERLAALLRELRAANGVRALGQSFKRAEVIDRIEQLLARGVTLAAPDTESAWLLERGQAVGQSPCTWWAGINFWNWSDNADGAVRFSRRRDAERVADYLQTITPLPCTVVEHLWAAAPAPAARPEGPWQLLHDEDEGWFVARLPYFNPEAVYVRPLDEPTHGPFSDREALAVRDALNRVAREEGT